MMSTKEQERQAVNQIREIVEALGPDSYVGTALEGCLEDAMTNIENDWALSMNGRWQDAEYKIETLERALTETADKLIDEGERADGLQADIDALNVRNEDLRTRLNNTIKQAEDLHRELIDATEQIRAREKEIIRLKARLYDLMTAGA